LTHKERFFLLAEADRRRIGRLVAAVSVVHVVQFLFLAPTTGIGAWGGIVGNLVALYWCLAPGSAPNFWFGLLPYVWWIAALFDGLGAWRAISGSESSSVGFVLSVANLAILPFLAGPLIRLHRISQGGGQTSDDERIA
jgi:hypothetical protein